MPASASINPREALARLKTRIAELASNAPPPAQAPAICPQTRTPSWAEQHNRPNPGDRCACCKGGRWWAPTEALVRQGIGLGWRCRTCYPPLDDWDVETVTTRPGAHECSTPSGAPRN